MGLEKLYDISPVPLQTLMLNAKAVELYWERYGGKFRRLAEEFDRLQWLPLSDLREYQNERLRMLIAHAYAKVPYYHELMKDRRLMPSDIRTVEDLPKLPLLTKDLIRRHMPRMISTSAHRMLLRHGHTTGTTGSPLDLRYDIRTCVVHHVVDWRQKHWAGMHYGEPYACVLGKVIVPIRQQNPPFWRWNYVNNQLFLSSFHLKGKNLPHYFAQLRKEGIKFLEGYPSTVFILALYLLKNNSTFPLKAVLTSSETLYPQQRDAIEKAFCCRVFDFYGMAERTVYATECEHHNGHHLNLDYGITEFLDRDDNPAPAGNLARIVATSLHNFAMPMIRYVTNDSSSLRPGTCACGRNFPLMDEVATKNESIVTLRDGRLISPSVLTHPFKPLHSVAGSQIIQLSLDELLVRIVRGPGYSSTDEVRLLEAFHERLGDDIRVQIEYVAELPCGAGGKFRWVISHIDPFGIKAQAHELPATDSRGN
jgi:phenylacetate-CoA ligase